MTYEDMDISGASEQADMRVARTMCLADFECRHGKLQEENCQDCQPQGVHFNPSLNGATA